MSTSPIKFTDELAPRQVTEPDSAAPEAFARVKAALVELARTGPHPLPTEKQAEQKLVVTP